ncbi:MAG: ferritin family protein [Christensenellales bacterium]
MDILSQAILVQQEGQRYYADRARQTTHNAFSDVFAILAEDEKRHEMILQASRDHLPYQLEDNGTAVKVRELFAGLGDLKSEIPAPLEQTDIYLAAFEMEKKSVALLDQLMASCADPDEKALYAFLIDQEEQHVEVMEGLYRHINRPNEWVEAAEFGLREEY